MVASALIAVALASTVIAAPGVANSAEPIATPKQVSTSQSGRKRIRVPASVDATGSRDVSGQLNDLISRAPNRSTIVFKPRGTYRLGRVLRIMGKTGITLQGNRATLRLTGPGSQSGAGIFVEHPSRNTKIRNLTIVGNHAAAGTAGACCSREGQHGIGVFGSSNTLIEKVHIKRIGGDCFNVARHDARVWTRNLTVRRSTCRLTGRHGLAIEGGRRIRLLNNVFDKLGFMFVDIEPGGRDEGASGVLIRGNRVKSYGATGRFDSFFLAACDAPWGGGSVVQNVTVTRNTVGLSRSGWHRGVLGLHILVCGDTATRRNFRVTHNKARGRVGGGVAGVMRFHRVRGVTVIGNRQPLSGGKLASFSGSTNVTYRR